jgi:4'-phosphopantetheinyl transferase EntD
MTPDALLRAVIPPGVFSASLADGGQSLQLQGAETALMIHAASSRQREFALGRACARAALAALGHGDAMLGRRADGAPLWPCGVVGSISHTRGLAVALAAPADAFRGLGVDVEQQGRVTPDLYRLLFDSGERTQLAGMAEPDRDRLAALCFSAKEACCKIWLDRHGASLPFTAIRVTMAGGDFIAECPARNHAPLAGRAALGDGLVLAVAWAAA